MACHLFGAKPLSKPMLGYCQLDPWEQTSMKLHSKYKTFHSCKCNWQYRMLNGGHFVQGGMFNIVSGSNWTLITTTWKVLYHMLHHQDALVYGYDIPATRSLVVPIQGWTKWPTFCRPVYEMHFVQSNTKFFSLMVQMLGNDFTPNRRQAIIWTNNAIVLRRHMVVSTQCKDQLDAF